MLEAIGASNDAQKNIWFTNTDPITAGISQPKPDYYHGAPPEQIHQQVREDLSSHIIPSTQTKLPAVPNFSMEVKGPRGIVQEAELQACNNGAIGARAMHSLQNYGQDEPVYHNRVSTISSTYHFGHLMMYGHSIAQPNGPGTEPHYYMHQLGDFSMTHSTDTFLQGATAFKNSKDLMKEYRNTAIAQANAIAATRTAEDQEDEEDEDGEDEDGEDEDGEDEDGEDEDGEDEDGEDDAGADTMLNFAAGTSDSIPSMLVKNEDEEEDPDDSKTSVERRPPPRKKRKSCETSDMSKGSSKKSCGKKGSGKGKAWFSFGLF
jgi:hypothetical protein